MLNHGGDQDAADAALRRKDFGVFRKRDGDGNQIVQCRGKYSSRKYSYTWPADREQLKPGDRVLLPPAPAWAWERYGDKPWEAEVVQLGTCYGDELAQVIRRIPREPPT